MSKTLKLPGLRERKAARMRLHLVEAMVKELQTKSFQEMNIEDLCSEVMISKVTFFNYFATKDHLLQYFSSVWMYQFVADCQKADKTGIEAIRFLFEHMAGVFNRSVNVYRSFIAIGSNQLSYSKVELTAADILELYPDGSTLDMTVSLSMGEFLKTHCELAFERGEITTQLTPIEIGTLIGALYHGSGLVGLRIDPKRPGDTYLTTFNAFIKLIQP